MALPKLEKISGTPLQAAPEAEAAAFLRANPDVQSFDCLFVDICGAIRGKRYPIGELEKVAASGLQIPLTIYLLDARGETTDAGGRGFGDGDPDGTAFTVPGTITRVAGMPHPHAQGLMSALDEKGEPYFAEPRNVLARVVSRFRELELVPVVAAELEFYAIDRARQEGLAPQPPIAPGSRTREASVSVYGIDDLNRYHRFLSGILDGAALQGVPATTTSSEHAPGQFEINLKHQTDPLRAADHAVFLKQVIRNIAHLHEMEATFMAKPYLGRPGSGMHIHVSLVHTSGRNVFDDGTARGSEFMRYAVGGLQAVMSEAMAIWAPNVNSFRRFVPNAFTPVNRRWGYNNRSTGIRIPAGSSDARRIEHRVSGADANPYLAIAAVLAGMHHGIVNRIDPGPPFEGNASAVSDATVPFSPDPAILALENGVILGDYLGPEYVQLYCATKRIEQERYRAHIPPSEYLWYL